MLKKILYSVNKRKDKNTKYDKETLLIINSLCKQESNCIDIGCHKGMMLDVMPKQASEGRHFAFEPIPYLFEELKKKYSKLSNCYIYDIALSNYNGKTSFNLVKTNPAYSGIKKRKYQRENEEIEKIEVKVDKLDNIIPSDLPIDLIKIDVEGGELQVIEGAVAILSKWRPVVIFEHGIGAADYYGSKPEDVFDLFEKCGMKISLMEDWLKNKSPLSKAGFKRQFYKKLNFYFIAHA